MKLPRDVDGTVLVELLCRTSVIARFIKSAATS
jgi:hypothetical protein